MAKEATEMNGKVNDAECVIKIIHKNQKPKNFSLNFFCSQAKALSFTLELLYLPFVVFVRKCGLVKWKIGSNRFFSVTYTALDKSSFIN